MDIWSHFLSKSFRNMDNLMRRLDKGSMTSFAAFLDNPYDVGIRLAHYAVDVKKPVRQK